MSIERIYSDRLIFIPFTLAIATSILDGNLEVLKSWDLKLMKTGLIKKVLKHYPKL